jgi:hypothetical protein
VAPGSSDYRQLLDWLAHRPSDEVFRAALEAIRIGLSVLPPDESEQRIATMIKACADVAQAAGWIDQLFQLDGASRSEAAVIAAIREHLQSKKKSIGLAGRAAKEVKQKPPISALPVSSSR